MQPHTVDQAVTVGSPNVNLGRALREHVTQSVRVLTGKYLGKLNVGAVHFNKDGPEYRCTVNIQIGGLRMMSAEAASRDIYASFDLALEKVAKQLRRTKRRLREDKAERPDKLAIPAERLSYVPLITTADRRASNQEDGLIPPGFEVDSEAFLRQQGMSEAVSVRP